MKRFENALIAIAVIVVLGLVALVFYTFGM